MKRCKRPSPAPPRSNDPKWLPSLYSPPQVGANDIHDGLLRNADLYFANAQSPLEAVKAAHAAVLPIVLLGGYYFVYRSFLPWMQRTAHVRSFAHQHACPHALPVSVPFGMGLRPTLAESLCVTCTTLTAACGALLASN